MNHVVRPALRRALLPLLVLAGCTDASAPTGPEPPASPSEAAQHVVRRTHPDLAALRVDEAATTAIGLPDVVVFEGLTDQSARGFVRRTVPPDHPLQADLRTASIRPDSLRPGLYDVYVPGPGEDEDEDPCALYGCGDDDDPGAQDDVGGSPRRGGEGGGYGSPGSGLPSRPPRPVDTIETDSGSGAALNLVIGSMKYITFASWTRSPSTMYKVVLDITMEVNGVPRLHIKPTKKGGVTIFNGFTEFSYGQTVHHWGPPQDWRWICRHIITPTGSMSPQQTDYSQADITI